MKVLLIGGYGGFGARITRRLADDGHDVLVAGRSMAKAAAFCAGDPRLTPMVVDRGGELAATTIAECGACIVVDAAGPFQGSSYAVPRACIAAGVHYCDIADARAFVTGIGSLDADARAAGVAVIAGASSVPALSGAAVRALANGMEDVRAIEMAISASPGATAGAAVTAAILGQIGRPLRLWRHARWTKAYGWQEPRRETFAVPGRAPLRAVVALADVPDLDLLPDRMTGRPAVIFRAGTGILAQTLSLVAGGWLVRRGLLRSLSWLARWALQLQRATAWLGDERSAMVVRLFGVAGDCRVERRWTLVAEKNDGPELPALAVPLVIARLDELSPGTRDAGELLTLADFEPALAGLHVSYAIEERTLPPPLYARVMGPAFDRLPQPGRAIHDVLRDGGASGRATVKRGRHPLARLVAALVGFPAEGEHEVHVDFRERERRGDLDPPLLRTPVPQHPSRTRRAAGGAVRSTSLCVRPADGCERVADDDARLADRRRPATARARTEKRGARMGGERSLLFRRADRDAADRAHRPLSRVASATRFKPERLLTESLFGVPQGAISTCKQEIAHDRRRTPAGR